MSAKIDGILRCLTCGHEQARVPKSLGYGSFPTHCGHTMTVITPQMQQEEREYAEQVENEANFERSLE